MRKKKPFIWAVLAAVIDVALLGAILAILIGREGWDWDEEEYATLEEMAYDKSGRRTVVYIKEDNEYIPYLVLESDYGGNVLLFRENVLPEPMPYRPSPYGESTTASARHGPGMITALL